MAEKVISIKIGSSVTQVAEVDFESKNPKIHHAFSLETPEGVLDDGNVHPSEEFADRIRDKMARTGMKSNRVVFTTSSARVATREVTIPLVNDKKIKQVLIANSKEYFPVDLAEYQLVYRIIEKIKSEKQMKLMVYAVPNTLVQSYQTLAKVLDLQVASIDYYGNSVFQAMLHTMPTDLSATICVEGDSSIITIVRDGQIALQRTIGYGIDDAVHELTDGELARNGMTYKNALEMLRTNQYIADNLKAGQADSMNAKRVITGALTMMVGNISRVLDYYFSRNTDVQLTRITLAGLGADCLGLDRLLSNELEVYVETVHKFGNSDVGKDLSGPDFCLAEYYGAIAATLKPLNITYLEEHEPDRGGSIKLAVLVCVGGVGISLAVVLMGFLSNMFVDLDNQEMEQKIRSKSEVIEVYNNYITAKVINQEVSMIDVNTDTPNENMLTFIGEMEESMPSDMTVTSFSSSNGSVSMSLECGSKASASTLLMDMRDFTTVAQLTTSGVSETLDDSGSSKVTFSVTFNLVTPPEIVPEETEEIVPEETEAGEITEIE